MYMSSEHESLFEVPELYIDEAARLLSERVDSFREFLDYSYDADSELEVLNRADEIHDEVEALDALCPYIHTPVRVSGRVVYGYFNELTERSEVSFMDISNEPMVSEGFTVLEVPDVSGEVREQVGLLFRFPGIVRIASRSLLTQDTTTYYAFAPYGSITVEAVRTPVERIAHLQQMTPDIIDEIDIRIDQAGSPIDAAMGLGEMAIDPTHIPSSTLSELISYATDVIELDNEELFEVTVHGTMSVEHEDGVTASVVPHDWQERYGGQTTLLARCRGLFLRSHYQYIDSDIHSTADLYWHMELDVSADKNQQSLSRVDIAITDIIAIRSISEMIVDGWSAEP